jgi:PucR C-terminal helix-turn-helix domain
LERSTVGEAERSALSTIAEALLDRLEELADRCAARFQEDSDAYSRLSAAELHASTVAGVRAGLACVTQLTQPGQDVAAYAARIGELRARQHVPVEAVMQTFQVAAQEVLRAWDQEAARLTVPTEVVLRVHDLSWAWANFAMTHAARAHGRADRELARHGAERRSQFVRDLLLGRLKGSELKQLSAAHGLQITIRHMTFRASLDNDAEEAAQLDRALRSAAGSAQPLTTIIDGDLAGLLPRAPMLDNDGPIGLGPLAEPDHIPASFAIATETLKTAQAFGHGGVRHAHELGLLPAVLLAGDLGQRLDTQHFAQLDQLGPFGHELQETVRMYFASARNIGATAHALSVHPNSVRHRLDRFREITSLDLRDTNSLVTAWWLLTRRTMTVTPPR